MASDFTGDNLWDAGGEESPCTGSPDIVKWSPRTLRLLRRRRPRLLEIPKLREFLEEQNSCSQVRPENAPRALDLRRRERSVPRAETDSRSDWLLEVRAENGEAAQVESAAREASRPKPPLCLFSAKHGPTGTKTDQLEFADSRFSRVFSVAVGWRERRNCPYNPTIRLVR
jgi:hypothetical protein